MDQSARFELKYLIPSAARDALLRELGGELTPDAVGGGRYPVVTLYYDSPDLDIYWEHWRGVPFRRKLRVRTYGSRDGAIPPATFLEIKRKDGPWGAKRRLRLPLEVALAVAAGDQGAAGALGRADRATAEEAAAMVAARGLRPCCLMRYDRLAFARGEGEDALRLTFDSGLLRREHDLVPRPDETGFDLPVVDPGLCVMEIKGHGAVPLGLARLLSRHGLRPRPFSKYAAATAPRAHPSPSLP
jgi:hypothetical protein